VLQGERSMAKDNKSLGRFHLDGIPPMRRGEAQIEVTFDIDANGILNVSAKENKTGKQQNIRIEASSGLSKEEIEKMKREAAENADSDREAKDRIDKLNQADGLIFQVEKQLEELGDKLPADKKQTIESALTELKAAHQLQDLAAVEAATTKVNETLQAMAADIQGAYQGGAAGGAQANAGGSSSKDAEVTDVDFEEVADEKK